jgi:hypothetical protein
MSIDDVRVPEAPVDPQERQRADEERQLARVEADLVREFGEQLTAEQVAERFAHTVGTFAGAPIRSFVPVLAQRSARQQLRRAAAGSA